MSLMVQLIHGLSFGIEHIAKDSETQFPDESCIVLDIAIVRFIIGMGDFDQ